MTPVQAILYYLSEEGSIVWANAQDDYILMSLGTCAYGIRQEYYPTWTDEDFKRVLIAVNGSYEY